MEARPLAESVLKKDKSHHGPAAICRSDTGSHGGIKGYTSKTQTVVFFHSQLTEKPSPNVADPLLDLVSTFLF